MLKPDSDKEPGKETPCDLEGTNNVTEAEAARSASPFPFTGGMRRVGTPGPKRLSASAGMNTAPVKQSHTERDASSCLFFPYFIFLSKNFDILCFL